MVYYEGTHKEIRNTGMCICKRCGEEINRVHWYDGAAYGSSCIKIVAGKSHGVKPVKYVEVTAKQAIEPVRDGMEYRVFFECKNANGKKVTICNDHAVKNSVVYLGDNRWHVLAKQIPKGFTV